MIYGVFNILFRLLFISLIEHDFAGMSISTYLRTLRYQIRPSMPKWLMAYITILFLLATAGVVLQIEWNMTVFIDNRNYPGGPFTYLQDKIRSPLNISMTGV